MVSYALDFVYDKAGIKRDDVVRLTMSDLKSYRGEKLTFPVSRVLVDYPLVSTAISEDITPIFISFVLFGTLSDEDAEYLKRFEPIGCRDYYTMNELRRKGVRAYIFGCLTACFPKRENLDTYEKTFLVDVEPELEDFLPDAIRTQGIRLSHIIEGKLNRDPVTDARKYYEMYRDSAALVITSRLHAAAPCAAVGIPVILAKNSFSSRFTWIDCIVDVYDASCYDKIVWCPKPAQFESHKKNMLDLAIHRITTNGKSDNRLVASIEDYYCQHRAEKSDNRLYVTAISKVVDELEERLASYDGHEYAIWGVSAISESINRFIANRFPYLVLTHVYDKFRKMEFCGLISESLEAMQDRRDLFIVACPLTEAIQEHMEEYLGCLQLEWYFVAVPAQ
jgi:hypothetical protein